MWNLRTLKNAFDTSTSGAERALPEPRYRWGILEYQGLAWRGELWLDDNVRLGPPCQQYEEATRGPRVVVVDAIVDCISQGQLSAVFGQLLEELAAFLTVVVNASFHLPGKVKSGPGH